MLGGPNVAHSGVPLTHRALKHRCAHSTVEAMRQIVYPLARMKAGGRVVDGAVQTVLEVVTSIATIALLATTAMVLRSVGALQRTQKRAGRPTSRPGSSGSGAELASWPS